MILPEYVLDCLQRLEAAGFACYAVGGCVRDSLLGLTPHDYDLCTAATPTQTKEVFADCRLVLAGEKHGTVGVITSGGVVEITTFRTEGQYLDNRHPDSVCFVRSIEEDLARRDFTVNAMAWSPIRGLADPFGGASDLKNQVLRAVGDPYARFQEDSLRILRGVRFGVRFSLKPEEKTLAAMVELADLMDNLARERVFDELCKLLPLVTASDLAKYAPILTQVIPELAPCVHFDQHNPHHAYDLFTHIAHVVEGVPAELPLRWAALLHDIGKPDTFTMDSDGNGHFYGHAKISAQMADGILHRLKAPNQLREEAVRLIDLHMTKIEPEKKLVRRWLSRLGSDTMEQLLRLQEADMGSKGTGRPQEMAQFDQLRNLIAEIQAENSCLQLKDLAVNGHDLMELGISGPAIGQTLNHLLSQVLDDALPNKKQALLASLKKQ